VLGDGQAGHERWGNDEAAVLRLSAARFSALALLAIVVPAAIVAVLGYLSLRQWDRSAELLFREQARDTASMAAEKVSMVLRHGADDFLSRLEARLAGGAPWRDAVSALLRESPLVARLYLVERRGALVYPPATGDAERDLVRRVVSEVPDAMWERGGRRAVLVGDDVVVAAVVRSSDGRPVIAAIVRDFEVLCRQVLDTALGGLEAPTVAAVLDHHGRRVWSRAPVAAATPLSTAVFPAELPGWRLALYQSPSGGPREAVRHQVTLFTVAFGVLLLIIVAGIVMTWRLMQRETEMARLKTDFVANVSHDLKTPLSVIRMFGETLEMGRVRSDAQRGEYYRVITREAERLSRLIDNVLDFSRIESGRRRYDIVPAAIEPIVRETLEAFAYPLSQQGFKVDVSIAPGVPDVALDAEAVGQALANLIDNAMKYAGDRRVIRLDVRRRGDEVAIAVADEGIGIPREEHARIFEKFYRAGSSDTQGRRGSGVGLALVRHVAEAHAGRVTVESEPGQGSCFTLILPVGRAAEAR
jgi:signal transduction histidine kinase